MQTIVPDVENSTSVKAVCATLTKDECDNWLSCCAAARVCCSRQISLPAAAAAESSSELNGSTTPWCSRTWDGFSCFDDTPPSSVAVVPCPTFMQLADTSRTLPTPHCHHHHRRRRVLSKPQAPTRPCPKDYKGLFCILYSQKVVKQ